MAIAPINENANPLGLELGVYYITFTPDAIDNTKVVIKAGISEFSDVVSFGYRYWLSTETAPFAYTASSSDTVTISGLTPGSTYKFQMIGYSGLNKSGQTGVAVTEIYTVPLISSSSSLQNGSYNPGTNSIQNGIATKTGPSAAATSSATGTKVNVTNNKTLYVLSNGTNTDVTSYKMAYKLFPNLNTTGNYYAFGTTLFFDGNEDIDNQAGGLAFFMGSSGESGYMIKVDTTSNAASQGTKEFKIFKIKHPNLIKLEDSQTSYSESLNGVYGGKSYRIDVLVKHTSSRVDITCYINGFKITASDVYKKSTNGKTPANVVLSPTKIMGMICNVGQIKFDYLYAMPISETEYAKDKTFAIYDGQYSAALIANMFGQQINNNKISNTVPAGGVLEEFGTVAREIRHVQIQYENPPRPAYPLYASTSTNNLAQVVYSKLQSFTGDVYTINNSGTSVPLDDGGTTSFYILGKMINSSGSVSYTTNGPNQYTIIEPAAFSSTWIQKESDAISLAKWIEDIWSHKQSIINLTVFGNPFISVGDIIAIDYPYNNLDYQTQKFIVTNINHSYDQGLETQITCRTLVS